MFAEVIVKLATRRVDRVFQYLVPENLRDQVKVGSRVLVPFGRQQVEGYVTGFSKDPQSEEMKEISNVLDQGPVFTNAQLVLARWMASYYLCPTVSTLQMIIWPRLAARPRLVQRIWPAAEDVDLPRSPAQARTIQVAMKRPGLTRQELACAAGVSTGVVNSLVSKGLLCQKRQVVLRDPLPKEMASHANPPPVLNSHQAKALKEITDALDKARRDIFLLQGVTGSGKTEVYLQSVARVLALGRQAAVLVPEIALTPQMVELFKSRFGHQVAVLHSRLSAGERYDEYSRIENSEARVILGTRSALFAPFANLGLIVIDEEHEPSYKQEETPRYHSRTVAIHMAGVMGAVVILGSATPSIESFYFSLSAGPYRLLQMHERVESRPLPQVQLVDMKKEFQAGNKGVFSRKLLEAIQDCLRKKEQAILFLNRRGFSTFVVCRECGLVMKCPHCAISLTYHTNGRLICHYCNYSVLAPDLCPGCQGRFISYFGTGTQKIEHEVYRFFPKARVLRLDRDATKRKGSHQEILSIFREGKADILIGTQMVAKGLDIPQVTLVGVVNADLALHMPDFRASERTFQLLTQVAGRTGRGELGGEVLIQTYSPEHYAITAAKKHDYEDFFRQELSIRRSLGYPPFASLCRFVLAGIREKEVEGAAQALHGALRETIQGLGLQDVQIFGPAPAPLPLIKDRYRWHLIVKATHFSHLHETARTTLTEFERRFKTRRVITTIDMEPYNII